jgi:hypothetical protein
MRVSFPVHGVSWCVARVRGQGARRRRPRRVADDEQRRHRARGRARSRACRGGGARGRHHPPDARSRRGAEELADLVDPRRLGVRTGECRDPEEQQDEGPHGERAAKGDGGRLPGLPKGHAASPVRGGPSKGPAPCASEPATAPRGAVVPDRGPARARLRNLRPGGPRRREPRPAPSGGIVRGRGEKPAGQSPP